MKNRNKVIDIETEFGYCVNVISFDNETRGEIY